MPHYEPTQDRLLVLQDWGPKCHPGTDVAIPEPLRAKQRPNTGTVAEVGPGRRYDDGQVYPLVLQKGQRVMFAPAETLTKVDHDGQEHLMMREQDVFLVLGEPKKRAVAVGMSASGELHPITGTAGPRPSDYHPNDLPKQTWTAVEWVAERNSQGAKSAIFNRKLSREDEKAIDTLGLNGLFAVYDLASNTTSVDWQ